MRHLVAKDSLFFQVKQEGKKKQNKNTEKQAVLSHHWPVHIPKGPFLTIQNFPFCLVLLPIYPERAKKGNERPLLLGA